jgi:hypothetical protein
MHGAALRELPTPVHFRPDQSRGPVCAGSRVEPTTGPKSRFIRFIEPLISAICPSGVASTKFVGELKDANCNQLFMRWTCHTRETRTSHPDMLKVSCSHDLATLKSRQLPKMGMVREVIDRKGKRRSGSWRRARTITCSEPWSSRLQTLTSHKVSAT